jgi:hypothetical protein
MPAEFDKCKKDGGKIRTKSLSGGKYIHLCILNGKSVGGEVREAKKNTQGYKKLAKK